MVGGGDGSAAFMYLSLNEQDQALVCLDHYFICNYLHAWVMYVNGLSAILTMAC